MKLPRDVSGSKLVKALRRLDYQVVRQRGSHVQLIHRPSNGNRLVIPDHAQLKPGLLGDLLNQVASYHGVTRDELIEELKL